MEINQAQMEVQTTDYDAGRKSQTVTRKMF